MQVNIYIDILIIQYNLNMEECINIYIHVETLNLGELLYSVEFVTKILIRKLEKLIKFSVLFN